MTEYEALLSQVIQSKNKKLLLTEKYLAEAYKNAYSQVELELNRLYTQISGSEKPLADAYKYQRLEKLRKAIQNELNAVTNKIIKNLDDHFTDVFTDGYYGIEWATNTSFTIANFGVLPVDAIRASVYSEISGKNYIETFRYNVSKSFADIKASITRGLATGQSYTKTAKEIKDYFVSGYADAVRVVRTETTRNYSEGNLIGFEKAQSLGIPIQKIWLATLDNRTRVSHGHLDGKEADDKGYWYSGGVTLSAPGIAVKGSGKAVAREVINCRCDMLTDIDHEDERWDNEERKLIPYQSYEEWKKGRI